MRRAAARGGLHRDGGRRTRRRLLLWPAPEVSDRVAEIRSASIDQAVAAAMKTDDQERVAEVVDALELLAGRLSPEVLSRPSDRPIEAEN